VLDLCAAPGGKTMQLAAAGARVTALDLSAPRLRRLRANLDRTGLAAEVLAADLLQFAPGRRWDAILLDAPCTASGTIRRHPDLPLVLDGGAVAGLVRLQARMLERAFALLAPGGRLVFSTCSLLPAEGPDHVAGRSLLPFDLPGLPEGALADRQLRLRPDMWAEIGGIDGFFAALLSA
jgi:16S rRNA (cytosine967-C5)-methyltransferase